MSTPRPGGASRRDAIVVALGIAALIAGVAILLAVSGVVALVVGIVLVGLGGIGLVSFAFLLVGEGEDRDRLKNPRG